MAPRTGSISRSRTQRPAPGLAHRLSQGRIFAYRTVKKASSQPLSPRPVSKGARVLPGPMTACWPLPGLIAAHGHPISIKARLLVTEPSSQGAPSGALRRTVLRLAAVLALVFLLHQLLNWASAEAELGAGKLQIWMLALFLLAYAVLIAVPFVPGVEVGLTLMVMEGPLDRPMDLCCDRFRPDARLCRWRGAALSAAPPHPCRSAAKTRLQGDRSASAAWKSRATGTTRKACAGLGQAAGLALSLCPYGPSDQPARKHLDRRRGWADVSRRFQPLVPHAAHDQSRSCSP